MSELQDFIIENGVLKKYIGQGGDVINPDGVESIDANAFEGCIKLTSVIIPEGVTNIGRSAFSWCGSLRDVTIPNSLVTIASNAWGNCMHLQCVIKDGLKYLGNSNNPYIYLLTTTKNKKMTTAKIHSGCKFIADRAFEFCATLTEVVLPDTLISIGYGAFKECSALTRVNIPEGITKL